MSRLYVLTGSHNLSNTTPVQTRDGPTVEIPQYILDIEGDILRRNSPRCAMQNQITQSGMHMGMPSRYDHIWQISRFNTGPEPESTCKTECIYKERKCERRARLHAISSKQERQVVRVIWRPVRKQLESTEEERESRSVLLNTFETVRNSIHRCRASISYIRVSVR